MRFLAVVPGLVLATAALVAASAAPVRADVPTAAERTSTAPAPRDVLVPPAEADARSPRPGTVEEADDYARREAESPEVREFVGGFIIFLLVVTVLILLIILLAREI